MNVEHLLNDDSSDDESLPLGDESTLASPPPAKRIRRRFVDSSSYGLPPPSELSSKESMRAKIYHFADLPQERGESIHTDPMKALGHMWKLRLYPRGSHGSDEETEQVSVFLQCLDVMEDTNKKIKTVFTMELGSNVILRDDDSDATIFSHEECSWGFEHDSAKRSTVLSKCLDEDGTLTIDVHIQIYGKYWYPPKPEESNALLGKQMMESPFGADVSIAVGEQQQKFQAHKVVLFHRAPSLYEFIQGVDLKLPDVTSTTFESLLDYIYTGNLPDYGVGEANLAKELLLVSDRFAFVMLKLYVESEITSKFINTSNAADWLMFSDGHSCPLLMEACMELHSSNPTEVMASPSWPKIMESPNLLSGLFLFAASKRIPKDSNDYDNMTVRRLREVLEVSGLDLDGTRTMLIRRLKEYDYAAAAAASDDDDDDDAN